MRRNYGIRGNRIETKLNKMDIPRSCEFIEGLKKGFKKKEREKNQVTRTYPNAAYVGGVVVALRGNLLANRISNEPTTEHDFPI